MDKATQFKKIKEPQGQVKQSKIYLLLPLGSHKDRMVVMVTVVTEYIYIEARRGCWSPVAVLTVSSEQNEC